MIQKIRLSKIIAPLLMIGTSLFSQGDCKGPFLCSSHLLEGVTDCCHMWDVDIGLLYQKPAFTGMVAGVTYFPLFYQDPDEDFQDQTITPLQQCFDYTIGLTAGVGRYFDYDHQYLKATFNYLSANTTNAYEANIRYMDWIEPSVHIQSQIFIGTDYDFDEGWLDILKYSATMNIYEFDLSLSRGSFQSQCFSYEPYAGIKALWFSAKQTSEGYNTYEFEEGNAIIWSEVENNWGVGILFGVNSEYYFLENVALFSDSQLALLYGKANTSQTSILKGAPSSDIEVDRVVDLIDNVDCQFYLPVRSIIGIQMSRCIIKDRHYFTLKLGYDLRTVISYPNDENGFAMGGLYTDLIWNF